MTTETPAVCCRRVLLADANPTFLAAAARCLTSDGKLALVGQAATGAEALRLAADLQPDLVLIDIGLRDMNGLEVAHAIKLWPNPPRMIVLAFGEGSAYAEAARNAGADGFVTKIDFYEQVYWLIQAWYPGHREGA
jgi:DNA-binding NarL/FixJ family response regulator